MRHIQGCDIHNYAIQSPELVNDYFLSADCKLPIVVETTTRNVDLEVWLRLNAGELEKLLLKYGGILFRGFDMSNVGEFERIAKALANELLEYDFASTPRSVVKGNIYTSTEYPSHQEIILHNEMAYSKRYPSKIWFYCVKNAQEGGETPLASSRRVYQSIDPEIRTMFETRGLLYVRNYHRHLDLPWEKVFNTTDKEVVKEYCSRNDIRCTWINDGHLQTAERCPAVLSHPATGEKVWFNQAHLFHISNLEPAVRDNLLRELGVRYMPRNVFWGDGEEIPTGVLDRVREVYRQEKISFPWQKGDVLLLDNLLVAHGRNPFKGERKVLVAMTK